MRQAGRYLPEYRQMRERAGSFLDLCYDSDLAKQVTLQPLKRFDLDAAILFSDILVVPHAMGLSLNFKEGEGPQLEIVRDLGSVERLRSVAGSDQMRAICDTTAKVRAELPAGIALIGFCGAPWTVASYMIEGGASERQVARLVAYDRPLWFGKLIDKLVLESVEYLKGQVAAGAEVLQIFDSWAGDLPASLRVELVEKPIARMIVLLRKRYPEVPVIVFAKGANVDHKRIQLATQANAISIESELPLAWAMANMPEGCAIQGNLDPVALLGSDEVVERETLAVVGMVPMERHIFNLGHGIRPETRPEALEIAVRSVRQYDLRND